MSKKSKILVILGPTASGKSDLAIKLAKKFGGEVISADSRQIYRGMDIGTGKVEADQSAEIPKEFSNRKFYSGSHRKNKIYFSQRIPHYMIDIISPKTRFSAAQFKKKTDKIISDILRREKIPIICGGTGFWIQSIVDDIIYPEVKPDWKLRKFLDKKSPYQLFEILEKLDSRRAENIDRNNKVRLIRAIEICKKIGKVPALSCHCERSEIISKLPQSLSSLAIAKDYDFLQIGISLPKEKLHSRIEKRLEERFREGMIEEVRSLHFNKKISWKRLDEFGLEYRWIAKFLKKEIAENKMKEGLLGDIKKYAKRQMTWFGKDERIKWIKKYSEAEREARKFLK